MSFKSKNHCRRGHPLAGKNLYFFKSAGKTKRKCRACIVINGHSITTRAAKARWLAANRDRAAVIAKRWRTRHPEQAREVGRRSELKRRTEKHDQWLEAKRKWNAANWGKCQLYNRKAICKKHGMTAERYQELLDSQGGVCAVCSNPETGRNGNLSIDHDHKCCPGRYSCGKCVRGLLCEQCNRGIGCLSEDLNLFGSAIAYLQKHPLQTLVMSA